MTEKILIAFVVVGFLLIIIDLTSVIYDRINVVNRENNKKRRKTQKAMMALGVCMALGPVGPMVFSVIDVIPNPIINPIVSQQEDNFNVTFVSDFGKIYYTISEDDSVIDPKTDGVLYTAGEEIKIDESCVVSARVKYVFWGKLVSMTYRVGADTEPVNSTIKDESVVNPTPADERESVGNTTDSKKEVIPATKTETRETIPTNQGIIADGNDTLPEQTLPTVIAKTYSVVYCEKFKIVFSDTDKLIWKNENESVAYIDSGGYLVGVNYGETYITGETDDTIYQFTVTVIPPFDNLERDKKQIALNVGDYFALEDSGKLTSWSSGDLNVAQVDFDGSILALQPGYSEVRITCDGKIYIYDVIVE